MRTKIYLVSGVESDIGKAIIQKLNSANHTCILLGGIESSHKKTLESLPKITNASFINKIIVNAGVDSENEN